MTDLGKTREQLLEELEAMGQRVAELEASATEHQQAEGDLRASEGKHRAITEAALDSIFCKDLDSRYTFVNPAMEQVLGRPATELLGLTPRELFDEESAIIVEAVDAPVFRGETTNAIRTLNIQGKERTFHTVQVPLRSAAGEITGMCGFVRDVTEHRRTEADLRESEQRFRTALEALPGGVFAHDLDGRFLLVNEAACRNTGWSRDELLGMSVTDIDPDATTRNDRERFWLSLNTEGSITIEGTHLRKDGSRYPADIHLTGIVLDRQPIILAIAFDISESQQAEQARRALERQVQQAQKLESLGVLAGGIAHDFNNLLTALLGNADLAVSALPPDSPIRPLLLDVQNAGRRAADLTGQMLAYSGRGHFIVEDLDINGLVQDMSSLLESSTSKKARLSYELAAELPAVTADATQLRQIVMNLVTNGSEALGDEGGLVRVRTHSCDDHSPLLNGASPDGELAEGRYVVIEVSDTGCGMDDETQAKIFDPFFTTKFTGRGLGLAAVQGIVRGHQGAILVDSELGTGTTFKVLLPALDHPAEPVTPPTEKAEDWHGSGAILVVDDEDLVRKVAATMLEQTGFSVLTASDGVEAVALFRKRHGEINCVLLDLEMPRMDGKETFDELARIAGGVPVILSSGYSEQESTERFSHESLAGFLQKPYEVVTLRNKVREVLGNE